VVCVFWFLLLIAFTGRFTEPRMIRFWLGSIPFGLLELLHLGDQEAGHRWFYQLSGGRLYYIGYWSFVVVSQIRFARRGYWIMFWLPCLLLIVSFSGCFLGQKPGWMYRW
jgi:hypothetical protein